VRECEGGEDRRFYGFGLAEDLVVPETQHLKSLGAEISVTPQIVSTLGMLRTIRLDDQPLRQRHEIGNVEIDDLLPAELAVGKAPVAEHRPEALLRFGRVGTHPFGAGEEFLVGRCALTLPLASRAGPSLSPAGRG
jgi:hypothetical protein